MKSPSFFAELKRRNVYKVAVAYAVVAWLLIQIATQVFPFFEIPNWAVRLVVLLLALGFPVALVLAWAFELTPEGIKRADDVLPSESVARTTGRKLVGITIALALIAAAMLGYRFLGKKTRSMAGVAPGTPPVAAPTPVMPEKSIAVLPFENRSEDKANAYFADGIQDEILTRLSKIAELKVISRTSTLHYKSVPENLPEIARQLGVANILEGSVQKSADQVRVNVQLISAANDSHLWAEIYDRKLTDIFTVESEIAKAIAEKLQAKLTGREADVVAARPTENTEAYENYLRGLAVWNQYIQAPQAAMQALAYFSKATELDPKFAAAWGRLSIVHSRMYFSGGDRTPERAALAKQTAERAQQLQPDSLEGFLAIGYFYYWVEHDYPRALTAFNQAVARQPSSPEILGPISYIERRRGDFAGALAHQLQSVQIDPRNTNVLTQLSVTYTILRRLAEAHEVIERVLNIVPDDAQIHAGSARLWVSEGNLDAADAVMKSVPPTPEFFYVFELQVRLALMRHRYGEAIELLRAAIDKPAKTVGYHIGEYRYLLAWTYQLAGDEPAAHAAFEAAREELERLTKAQPDTPELQSYLGLTYAGLGQNSEAISAGRKAIALRPLSVDASQGPGYEENLARIYAQLGDADTAIPEIARLLQVNYLGIEQFVLTPATLRLDPIWDPIRVDARFQKLCTETQP